MAKSLAPVAAVICAALLFVAPAAAIDGEVLIAHGLVLSGDITPGDAPGYPATLTRPGHYKLIGNLEVPPGQRGIQAAAANITIDLAGFRITGAGKAEYGVLGPYPGLVLKNGTIRGFRFDEVSVTLNSGVPNNGEAWTVEDMRIVENGRYGIIGRPYLRVIDSVIAENTSFGIFCFGTCHIQGNVVSGNKSEGIRINVTGTVLGNAIVDNTSYGIVGQASSGFGDNTLYGNNAGGAQVFSGKPLNPNACTPAC